MPSTYTLNNGIELIGTGEQSGTWGDTTNTNFELIDTALDGQVTVTLASAGTSGAPNTLPISDGSASNGRNRLVIFNDGADLGATAYVQLTPSDAEKIVYVRNDLSGSRSIILFQGTYNASNDYEVPAGTTAVVYFDGAGAGAVAANVFNNAYFDSLRLGSVSVTAILDEDDMASDSATALATQQSIKKYVDDKTAAQNELSEVLANGNTTGGTDIAVSSGDDITFADNSKAIFGAGSDLQIYHTGSNSVITDAGTGSLYLGGDNNVIITSSDLGTTKARFTTTDVELYYAGAEKLATTNTGVDITGTAVTDGLTVDGNATIGETADADRTLSIGSAGALHFDIDTVGSTGRVYLNATNDGAAGKIFLQTVGTDRLLIDNIGDITFYDTSGNASFVYDESAGSTFNEQGDAKDFRVETDNSTHALYVEGSTDRIGINNGNPNYDLEVGNQNVNTTRTISIAAGGSAEKRLVFRRSTSDDWVFKEDVSENFSIDGLAGKELVINQAGADVDFRVESDANSHMLFVDASLNKVGINTSSPDALLDIEGGNNEQFKISGTDTNPTTIMMDYNSTGSADRIRIKNSAGDLQFATNNGNNRLNISQNGDITFYQDDGSTQGLFYDASDSDLTLRSPANSIITLKQSTNTGNSGIYWVDELDVTQSQFYYNQSQNKHWLEVNGNGFTVYTKQTAQTIAEFGVSGNYHDVVFHYGLVVNEAGAPRDFRVESDTQTHMLFVDASENWVSIGNSVNHPAGKLFVSGNIKANYSNEISLQYNSAGNTALYHKGMTGTSPETTSARGLHLFNYDNDSDEGIKFYSGAPSGTSYQKVHFKAGQTGEIVFNENSYDQDFRIESDSNANMFVVDAGENRVTINDGGNAKEIAFSVPTGISNLSGRRFVATISPGSINANTPLYVGSIETYFNGDSAALWVDINSTGQRGFVSAKVIARNGSGTITASARAYQTSVSGWSIIGYVDNSNSGLLHLYVETTSTVQFTPRITVSGVGNVYYDSSVPSSPVDEDYVWDIGETFAAKLKVGGAAVFNEDGGDYDFRVESDTNTHALFVDAGNSYVGVNNSSPTAPLSVTGDITQSPVGATNSFTAAIRTSGVQANDVGQFKVNYGGTEIVSLYGQWSGSQFQSGINIPYMPLRMIGAGNQRLTLYTEGIVVNEDSLDHDFRVESDSNANALFVDASANSGLGMVKIAGSSNPVYADAGFAAFGGNSNWGGTFETNATSSTKGALACTVINTAANLLRFNASSTTVGSITTNGTTTSYGTTSDYRLKENVVELTGATDRLKQLKPSRFNFISDPDTIMDGFLAHEVQQIVPEAVRGNKDEVDSDGVPVYQNVDPSKLVPLLVATIKELEARIAALESA